MELNMNEFRLCYVENGWAWFTTQDVRKQWGDDWNDAPYEHNAGEPYAWMSYMGERGTELYSLLKVAFDGPLETPDAWHLNSPWSVEQINSGAVAWLVTARYTSGPQVAIPAGTTLAEFIELVKRAGGKVYLPRGVEVAL